MRIHVTKDGQQFGPYTIDEIRAHLAAGHFSETDHGMSEGADEWQQISDLLVASEKPPVDIPASDDSSEEDDVDYEKLKQWEEQFEDLHEALKYIRELTGQRPLFGMDERTANTKAD